MSTASAEPEEPEHWASHTVSSIRLTNFPGIASSLKPALTSLKKSGLRQKGSAPIPDSDEEVVLHLADDTVVQEVVVPEVEVPEVQDPEAAAPDPAVAEIVPKAAAPERDLAVAAVTEIVEANRGANNYLMPKGVQ